MKKKNDRNLYTDILILFIRQKIRDDNSVFDYIKLIKTLL